MAAWADKNERFVEIPGIIEIRWVSDDPDYYVAPIDLFDEQSKGLPDYYGKKDKTTTEQAFFTCNICECELKSVVTLRAHCKGTQHIRKALNKKKEYRKSQNSGIEYVTEFKSSMKFNRQDEESEDFMSAALYVDPNEKDENEDKPPQDGMAYLRQVIKERKTVPETVVADYIPKKTSKSKPQSKEGDIKNTNSVNQLYISSRNKPPTPPGCCPGVDWQREQVKNFSDVRLKLANHVKLAKVNGEHELHQIPDKKNEALWCHLMLGGNIWNTVSKDRDTDSEEERIPKGKKEVKGEEPKLGFIAALPVHVCENVLHYMVNYYLLFTIINGIFLLLKKISVFSDQ